MPRSKEVTLGGVTYEVTQLPMKENRLWRNSLSEPVKEIAEIIQNNADLKLDADTLRTLVGIVKDVLLSSMDILLDALFRYAPTLAEDRERIEAEAYDDEAMVALGACVSLAYPLDLALAGLTGAGLPVTATSTNSRSPNGASGTKRHTVGRHRSTSKT